MSPETVAAIRDSRAPKGDPLEAARLAGIMAAKRTAELIPLCHPLPLTHVDVRAELQDGGVYLQAEVTTRAQTGEEMEALTAVSVPAPAVSYIGNSLAESVTFTDGRLELKKERQRRD